MNKFLKLMSGILISSLIVSCNSSNYKDFTISESYKAQLGITSVESEKIESRLKELSVNYNGIYDTKVRDYKEISIKKEGVIIDNYNRDYELIYTILDPEYNNKSISEIKMTIPIKDNINNLDLINDQLVKAYLSIFYENSNELIAKYNKAFLELAKDITDKSIDYKEGPPTFITLNDENTKLTIENYHIVIEKKYRVDSTLDDEEKIVNKIKDSDIKNKDKQMLLDSYKVLSEKGVPINLNGGAAIDGEGYEESIISSNDKYNSLFFNMPYDYKLGFDKDKWKNQWNILKIFIDDDKTEEKIKEGIYNFSNKGIKNESLEIGRFYIELNQKTIYGEGLRVWIYTDGYGEVIKELEEE